MMIKDMFAGSGSPDTSGLAKQQQQAQQSTLKAQVAAQTPDMLARAGGGISPQFLANLAASASGQPDQAMSALSMLRSQYPGMGG